MNFIIFQYKKNKFSIIWMQTLTIISLNIYLYGKSQCCNHRDTNKILVAVTALLLAFC